MNDRLIEELQTLEPDPRASRLASAIIHQVLSSPPPRQPRWHAVAAVLLCVVGLGSALFLVPRTGQESIAPAGQDDVGPLIERLGSESFDERQAADGELRKRVREARRRLREAAGTHADLEVRDRAGRILKDHEKRFARLSDEARELVGKIEEAIPKRSDANSLWRELDRILNGMIARVRETRLKVPNGFQFVGFARAGRKDGVVVVQIGPTEDPIELALCSTETIHWKLELSEGTRLTKVHLLTEENATVEGLPDGLGAGKIIHDGGDTIVLSIGPVSGRRLREITGGKTAPKEPVELGARPAPTPPTALQELLRRASEAEKKDSK